MKKIRISTILIGLFVAPSFYPMNPSCVELPKTKVNSATQTFYNALNMARYYTMYEENAERSQIFMELAQQIYVYNKPDINAEFYDKTILMNFVELPLIVKFLIEKGVDVHKTTREYGYNALHQLANSGNYKRCADYKDSLKLLWLARINMNNPDTDGKDTPLMILLRDAWRTKQLPFTVELVKLFLHPLLVIEKENTYFALLDPGIRGYIKQCLMDLRVKNVDKRTALDIARKKSEKENLFDEEEQKERYYSWRIIIELLEIAQKNQL